MDTEIANGGKSGKIADPGSANNSGHSPLQDVPSATPWQAAKDRFLGGLSADEIERFKEATPENLFQDVSAAQKTHAQGSKSWILQERLRSVVFALCAGGT
ncbi:hypothetical protein GQ44DRAFT_780479 [Phaeosphaeriaceae sp. PMI808]|nr:hypothetical protein GQ44DRAFT_780479 [Phaeosphaeriaceae sp. PMI808]